MSGPLTTWFAGLVMGALFGLAAGLCWVLPKLICALKRNAELEAEVDWLKANDEFGCECQRRYYKETQARIRELEAEVERLKAGDPQTHMQIGDVLDYWAKEQWHYIVCDADGWRTTEYIGKTAAEALAKIRKPRRKKIKEVMGDE